MSVTDETRPLPHEREIASLVLAEVDVAAGVLQDAGIDARVLGDPWEAATHLGVDPWTARMGIAVPHDQADRARLLLKERNQRTDEKIRRHTKGLWRVVLRVVALLALTLALSFLAAGMWRDHPVMISVLSAIVLVTVVLDAAKVVGDRRSRKASTRGEDWFDERRGRARRR